MQKRHSAFRFITCRPLVAAVAMLAGFLLTGIMDTSIALAATCNTADFESFTLSAVDGRTTYAVTKNVLSWNDAQALAVASGGRLATIINAGQNEEIATKLGNLFTPAPAPSSGNKAWIGLRDLANTGVWSLEGADIQLTPDRFSWASGTSNYTNYPMDQPDDYCTLAEKQVNPDRICYGEPWVTIEAYGAWSDEGDHGPTTLKLKGVVEWPNNILDCVKTTTPPTTIPDETLPGTENGALYCKDQSGLMLAECVATIDSGKFCPLDKIACEPVNAAAKCPTGSTLNTERDMCQADHLSVICPASYTWDSSIDRCVLPPTCAGGGVFNTITDRCETLISQDCPAGYTFNQGENKCTMAVVCAEGGTYNPTADRCEKSQSGTCDNGFVLNSTSGLCEKAPTCPTGTTYNNTYNKCISDTDSVCPAGYTWAEVRTRCEKTPECGTGASYSPVSGKCESQSPPSTSNYAAVQGPAFDTPFPLYFTGTMDSVLEMGYVGSQVVNLPTVETYNWVNSNPLGPFTVGPFVGTLLNYQIANAWDVFNGVGYGIQCQRGPDYYFSPYWYPSSFCGEAALAAAGCTSVKYNTCGHEVNAAGPWSCGWDNKVRVLGYNAYAICGNATSGTSTCPTGGTLSGTTCVFDSICADGSTPTDNVCQVNPTCTGGSFDTNTDTCFVTPNPCTDPGTTLDTALGRCTAAASCTPGVLDTAQDKCTVAPTSGCTAAYPLDPVAGVCASPVVCNGGVFVPAADRCEATVGDNCTTGYVYEPLINKCTSAPTCPTDIDFNMGEIILFSTEIDKCAAVPIHTCGADLTWMSTPYNKCEAIPVCDSPGVYSNTTDTCSAGVCPAGGTCKQISGDMTLAADGSPMTWCSPNQCQDDTAGMITGGDIPPQGTNDLTDDGPKNEDGTCAGQIYIFNGRDMRCTKDDMRGMIGSIAKIVAIIVASILTAGALAPLAQGLAVAMASTSIVTPAAAMAISSAIITSAVTSIMNLGIDAATVGIDGQAWAIQSSISLVSAGVMAYLGGAVTDGFKTFMRPDGAMVTTQTVTQTLPAAGYDAGVEAAVGGLQGNVQQGSLSLVSSTAGGQTLSTIGTYVGEPLIKTSDGIWQQIKNMGTSLSNNLLGSSTQSVQIFTDRLNHTITTITSTLTTSPTALAQSLYYAQQIGAVVQPAINAGMMASYQTKKCCNPDSIAASCEASEIEEWSLVEKGNCHRVGTYCDTKFLGMCMAHKETSCCFASKLARIIHEQGRPQLQAFGEGGGWGSPESPRCRGFTPDEFQMVDFGQLNLDEYVADLTAQIQQVGPGFQNYMDSVSADASNRANTLVPAGE